MTKKNTKKFSIPIIVSLIVVIFFVSCFPLSTGSMKWRIKWDAKLKAGKKEYFASERKIPTQQPNIILIVADDLGFNDVSCYGNNKVSTPSIDQLAKEGVKCTEGYVTSPICAPSRCGIITGRYQQRSGFETIQIDTYPTNVIEYLLGKNKSEKDSAWVVSTKARYPSEWQIAKQGVPPTEITLAELLKKYNYTTGIIGKWHLGNNPKLNIPNKRGFDYQYGCYNAFTLYADNQVEPGIVNYKREAFESKYQWNMERKDLAAIYENNNLIKHEKQYITDAIRDRSLRFIEENKDKPFFLYIPFTAPHEPYQAKEDLYKNELLNTEDKKKAVYQAIVRSMDDAIGTINQKIKDLNLEENTLIVFLSDNGPASYTNVTTAAPLKGGKITQFDGGLKVPFIFKWKNHLPENTTYNNPIISLDIFSTVASICKIDLPTDRIYDGVDLIPYLSNVKKTEPHNLLFWRADHVHAVRKGEYKLIFSTRDKWIELYDVKNDIGEKNNLVLLLPEKVKELKFELEVWEHSLPKKPLWPRIMDHRFVIDGKVYLFPA